MQRTLAGLPDCYPSCCGSCEPVQVLPACCSPKCRSSVPCATVPGWCCRSCRKHLPNATTYHPERLGALHCSWLLQRWHRAGADGHLLSKWLTRICSVQLREAAAAALARHQSGPEQAPETVDPGVEEQSPAARHPPAPRQYRYAGFRAVHVCTMGLLDQQQAQENL